MLYPIFAMVLLTYAVLYYTFRVRVHAVKSGQVSFDYFKLFQGVELPPRIQVTSRHITNQFEMPVLFYVAATLCLVLQRESALTIGLAWVFVATRLLHSWIHLTSNRVMWRMRVFMAGNFVLLALWLVLVFGG